MRTLKLTFNNQVKATFLEVIKGKAKRSQSLHQLRTKLKFVSTLN